MATNLYGIDVSGHQPKDITNKVSYDFAVVKVSGNPNQKNYKWNYTNASAKSQLDYAYKKTGLVGCYHFTYGLKDFTKEADFFVEQVKALGYLNKAVLVVDYEGTATKQGRTWIRKFCDRVKEKAGYAPILYSYGAAIKEQNLGSLGYPIWCANYFKGYDKIKGYTTAGMKIAYEKAKVWQFTSNCILPGYDSGLDANVFFGTKTEWKKLANITTTSKSTKKKTETEKISKTYKVISTDGMNVRKSYTVSSAKLLTLKYKEEFKAIKKHGNWVYAEKYNGWVCEKGKKVTYLEEVKSTAKTTTPVKPVESKLTKVAKDVIAGKYGNGILRRIRIAATGLKYADVQKEVNRLLKK